ncbi:hypothetical protein B484DRAFT_392759 [Ochromonadaceae sp. CCMP2298]|nr:hypothetical protein B484DRAFT_392759 [Ochromonadaceae sp. CCMP2298]
MYVIWDSREEHCVQCDAALSAPAPAPASPTSSKIAPSSSQRSLGSFGLLEEDEGDEADYGKFQAFRAKANEAGRYTNFGYRPHPLKGISPVRPATQVPLDGPDEEDIVEEDEDVEAELELLRGGRFSAREAPGAKYTNFGPAPSPRRLHSARKALEGEGEEATSPIPGAGAVSVQAVVQQKMRDAAVALQGCSSAQGSGQLADLLAQLAGALQAVQAAGVH